MKKILLVALWLSSMVFAGCGQQQNTTQNTTPASKTVKIWVIVPIGWALAGYGEDGVNVFKDELAAFQSANPDKKVEMIVEDGKCDGKDATSAAQKLITIDKVDVILGWLCSSETVAAGKIAQDNKIPLLSPGSSAPSISEIGDYVYRFWNDAFGADFVAKHLDQKMKKVAMVTENTDFAQGFAKAYKSKTTATIVHEQTYNSEEKDFDIIAKNIKAKEWDIDGIFIANQSDATAVGLLTALRKNGLLEKFKGKIYVAVGITVKKTLETMKDQIEWLMTYAPADLTKPQANKEYIKAFETKHQVKWEAMYLVFQKDWINLILDAVQAGNTDSASIKKYFDSFTENNKRKSGFGDFYFDQNWDAVGLGFDVLEVKNNETVSTQ